jgi:hypothetical protein
MNNHNQPVSSLSGGSATSGFILTGTGAGGTLTINNTGSGTTYGGAISGNGGLTLGLTNTATLTLTGANSLTGPVTINSGTLQAGANWVLNGGVALPITPPFNPLTTPYPGTFTLANNASASLDLNNNNIAIGSLQGGGPAGGNITLGLGNGGFGSGGTLQIVQSVNTVYAGVISGNGNVIFGSSAGGTITLVGNNTYQGFTYSDITTLGNNNALPISTTVIFTNSVSDGIQMNGFNQQVGAVSGGGNLGGNIANSGSGGGVFTIAATTNQLAINDGGVDYTNSTLAGALQNNVALVLDAGLNGIAQSFTLSGANNTTGTVTVGSVAGGSSSMSGVTNAVIVTATSTFGGIMVGNTSSVPSNLINSFTVNSTGVVTANGITLGDEPSNGQGNNSLVIGGTLNTTGAVNVAALSSALSGTNAITISGGGTLTTNSSTIQINVGDQNLSGLGTGALIVNGSLGTTAKPVGAVAIYGGGTLSGVGTITTKATGTAITISDGGTIHGGSSSNLYGTLTIAPASGTNTAASLVVQNQGSGVANPTIQANVNGSSASLILLTGTNKNFNLDNSNGLTNINLTDPTASLAVGTNYTFNLVQTSGTGHIQLAGGSQSANTVLDTGTTLGAGSGTQGVGDLYFNGNTAYAASITSWSLQVDSTGHILELNLTSSGAPVPEPHHIMLICVATLLTGLGIRRWWSKRTAEAA